MRMPFILKPRVSLDSEAKKRLVKSGRKDVNMGDGWGSGVWPNLIFLSRFQEFWKLLMFLKVWSSINKFRVR